MCAVKTSLAGQLERQSGGGGDDDDDQDNDKEDINDDDDDDWWWWWVSFQKDGVVVNWPLHCRDTFTRGLPESPGLSLSWACLARCLYLYLITLVQIQLHLPPARVSPACLAGCLYLYLLLYLVTLVQVHLLPTRVSPACIYLGFACHSACTYTCSCTWSLQYKFSYTCSLPESPRHVSFSGLPCRLLVLVLVTILGHFITSTGTLAPCLSLLGLCLSRACLAP